MKRLGVLLLVAATVAAGCADDDESGTPRSAESEATQASDRAGTAESLADFYEVPDPLPADEPGTLIRHEVIEGYTVGGGAAYRIMYTSRSARYEPVAVTGTVLVPDGEAPAGGRRLVTIAHGTTGVADECAPSKNPARSELSLMGAALEQGVVVVMSDYEGLGTPGVHPYLVAASEAHSVLDAARAARDVPGADAGSRFAIAGYSQGGHGALAASAVAASYAPELELVGTFAGAPPSEMTTILSSGPSIPQAVGFVLMMIAGTHEAYPEADPALVLTPTGVERLDEVEDGCVGEVLDRFATGPVAELFQPGLATVEPWVSLLKLSDQGQLRIDSPILIIHSKVDDVVPEPLSKIIFDRMCGLGQVVDRRLYESGDHGEAALQALPEALTWITQRFDDVPATSSC